MAISCVYCGALHDDPSQVRACWQRADGGSSGQQVVAVDPVPRSAPVETAPASRQSSGSSSTTAQAGPAFLGRNVIVRPGQQVPPEWSGAARVTIEVSDAEDASDLVTELRPLAAARERVVFEIDADAQAAIAQPASTTDAPYRVGARHRFHRDDLRHLMSANSIDLTSGEPRWPLLDDALALGARPVADGSGDIELPDGRRVWIDGGPIAPFAAVDGIEVLHRVAIEHGSLAPFGDNDTSADLAPDQRAAVTHAGGSARIIAPAGSGKTTVLTERARHLLRRWSLPPSAVCLVAFNKRAQQEMVERTRDLPGLQIRTLNAIALAIVNGSAPFAARPRNLATIDEGEVRRIIGRLVKFPRRRNADPVATWIEALSVARLGLRSPDDVEQVYGGEVDGFADMFPRFRRELDRVGSVDFDEQIQLAIEILLTDPAARQIAQRACRLLLVDEFQDLTPAHLLLVQLLAGPDAAVFGVGDDDQTIYGYNGADPAWLIEFGQLFPGSGEHPLEVNYRCPDDVVTAAATLLRHNRRRVRKTIRSAKPNHGLHVHPGGASVHTTVDLVTAAIAGGTRAADIAVLTRVNSLLAPVQAALVGAGVPVGGGVGREFADRAAVRAAIAWLRLATAGPALRSDDVAEALRRPARPMHPNVASWVGEQTSVDGLRRLAQRVNNERDAARVGEFTDDVERLQRLATAGRPTADLLAALRDSMGLASSIATLDAHRRGMNRAAQNDDLTAVAQLAQLQPRPDQFESWLRQVVGQPWQSEGVTLATVHRVKGQEWPFVIVHQADADQFPHRLADDVEEERRVFHVAITRASRSLHVVPDAAPSPFIAELSTEPSERTTTVIAPPPTPTRGPARASGKPGHDLTPEQAALFEQLRVLRRHLAAGKPAYTVLADAALHEIAVARPASLAELSRVRGVGPSKLEQFGAAILAVVEDAAANVQPGAESARDG